MTYPKRSLQNGAVDGERIAAVAVGRADLGAGIEF